jgi:hypothetical protein
VRLWLGHMNITERAFHAQPAATHRGEMRAARDEVHVMAGRGEAGAEVAADAA